MRSGECSTPAPWRMFAAHETEPFGFLLDRSSGEKPSFAGSHPSAQLIVESNGAIRRFDSGQWCAVEGDPIERICEFIEISRCEAAGLPEWLRGACLPRTVGFFSYELGRWSEPRALDNRHLSCDGIPLAVLSTYDAFDAWDPLGARSAHVRFHCKGSPKEPPMLPVLSSTAWADTSRESYRAAFQTIREAIAAGDIYQANLSRRSVFAIDKQPAALYRRLRDLQPVPWGAFLDFGGFALLSNSPECFLLQTGDRILTRPIKGTRSRAGRPDSDRLERAELRSDPKEMAEHLMIVDLERNDLGRVARTGTVEVSRFAEVESFSTLHHMVSEVRATLADGAGLAAVLRATFPGGSITGAPKIRAMQILAQVEPAERGAYTGAIGCFNGSRHLDLSIAIRTAVTSGNRMLYSTGGGIVADSDPEREWSETETKMTALRQALLEPVDVAAAEAAERSNLGATA